MKLLNQDGITLMETVVAATAMSIIAVLISQFLVNSLIDWQSNDAKLHTQNSTRLALNSVVRLARSGVSIEDNNTVADLDPAPKTGGFDWTSDTSTLVLATPATDNSQNIIYVNPTNYTMCQNNTIIYLDGGALYRRTLANPACTGNSTSTTCRPDLSPGCGPADSKIIGDLAEFEVDYLGASPASTAGTIKLTMSQKITKFGREITSNLSSKVTLRNH